jgi:hypothetical protein
MARTSIKLAWLEAVIAHLTADSPRPKNHSSILALAPVLVKHADPDGTSIYPGRPLMARASGLHDSTVAAALEYLVRAGLLVYVGNRTHGRHEYRLEVAQTADHPDSEASQTADHPDSEASQTADHPDSEGSQSADHPDSEGSQTTDQSADHPESAAQTQDQTQDQNADHPGTYHRTTVERRARDDELNDEYDTEFLEWAQALNAEKGGGPGLLQKILREDHGIFEEQRRQETTLRILSACMRCNPAGWLVDTDGEVVIPTVKCDHVGSVVSIEAAAR